MQRLETSREARLARLAESLVLCPDRRQRADRRQGPARGGRRATDPPAERLYQPPWMESGRQEEDGYPVRGAVAKFQARFRHLCVSAVSAMQFAITSR